MTKPPAYAEGITKYRQSKGMSNVGQPLSAADYTAMGLTSDGYKINKNATNLLETIL